jgi:hypothetical protein
VGKTFLARFAVSWKIDSADHGNVVLQMTLAEEVDGLQEKKINYHLYGVIVHGSPCANSGHYWAYTRAGDPTVTNVWYKLDCE